MSSLLPIPLLAITPFPPIFTSPTTFTFPLLYFLSSLLFSPHFYHPSCFTSPQLCYPPLYFTLLYPLLPQHPYLSPLLPPPTTFIPLPPPPSLSPIPFKSSTPPCISRNLAPQHKHHFLPHLLSAAPFSIPPCVLPVPPFHSTMIYRLWEYICLVQGLLPVSRCTHGGVIALSVIAVTKGLPGTASWLVRQVA